MHSFDGADPEPDVGIDRVLHEYRDVHSGERVGNFLHRERADGRARADPDGVDPMRQDLLDVLGGCDLGDQRDAVLGPRTAEPREPFVADALEVIGACARLPDPGAEVRDTERGDLSRTIWLWQCFSAIRLWPLRQSVAEWLGCGRLGKSGNRNLNGKRWKLGECHTVLHRHWHT